jgi:hypothetical protein
MIGFQVHLGAAHRRRRSRGQHRGSDEVGGRSRSLAGCIVIAALLGCSRSDLASAPVADAGDPLHASIYYPAFVARHPEIPEGDRIATLLGTPNDPLNTFIVRAVIKYAAPPSADYAPHDSELDVRDGDGIPTPHGKARVIAIDQDPGDATATKVRLQYMQLYGRSPDQDHLMFVGHGAWSHVAGQSLRLTAVDADGNACIALKDDKEVCFRKGDILDTGAGRFRVIDTAARRHPMVAFVTVDTRFHATP